MRTMEIREISLPFNPLNPTFILQKHKIINKKKGVTEEVALISHHPKQWHSRI
jgi:hypothetical protein